MTSTPKYKTIHTNEETPKMIINGPVADSGRKGVEPGIPLNLKKKLQAVFFFLIFVVHGIPYLGIKV